MSGAPGATTLYLSLETKVNYSDGSQDTLPANTLAVLPDATTSFDRTHDVFVAYTLKTSNVLSIVKESLLPTLTADYYPMARVELHGIAPYQPEPYLAASGLGGAPPAVETTLLSTTSARVYALGVGGTPPAGWAERTFDDSAWAHAVVATPGPGAACAVGGASPLWVTARPTASTEECLVRSAFTLASGTPSGATLVAQVDNEADLYVNGTLVWADTTAANPSTEGPSTVSVPLGLLVAGGSNVIAVRGKDVCAPTAPVSGQYCWVAYSLSVSVGGAYAEGDLLYYHDGAWVDLPIGTSGQELTVVSGEPAWATPAAGGVTSVAVAVPAPLSSSGGPLTSSGTITLSWASGQTANRVLASPNGSSGAVSLRALVGDDIPVDASTIISSAGTIKGNYQAGSGVSISGNTISASGGGSAASGAGGSVHAHSHFL